MKRWILMGLMLLFPLYGLCAETFYEEMPPLQRVTQCMQCEEIAPDIYVRQTLPQTANAQVDEQMRGLIAGMTEKNRPALPLGKEDRAAYLDVGAVITRTGTRWMSFLALAEISSRREMRSVDYDARVYDMETGERICMTDIFPQDSEAWAVLAEAVRSQLSAAFAGEEPDGAALEALCRKESLQKASFTLGAERMLLTYRADAVYAQKHTLLHVAVYYPDIRPMMTERAQEQTDNSRYRMIALTYDDGGARMNTRNVLDALRENAAQATFFIVGETMEHNREILCRQQNGAYSLQSHTYGHHYPKELTAKDAFKEKERFAQTMNGIIGVTPAMMRAPGGDERFYMNREIGYPLLHWSLASGDSGSTDAGRVARRVIRKAAHGDVVLMHDLNAHASVYTADIVQALTQQGFLCVTVEELFVHAGVPLEANHTYYSPYWAQKE